MRHRKRAHAVLLSADGYQVEQTKWINWQASCAPFVIRSNALLGIHYQRLARSGRYNCFMAQQEDHQAFPGFGIGTLPQQQSDSAVFILAVYRDGTLTAAAHASERSAMEAAVDYLEGEMDDEEEGGALEDQVARVQQYLADEGGVMEIIPSAVYGG